MEHLSLFFWMAIVHFEVRMVSATTVRALSDCAATTSANKKLNEVSKTFIDVILGKIIGVALKDLLIKLPQPLPLSLYK
jgi:uncharacterized membrane protein